MCPPPARIGVKNMVSKRSAQVFLILLLSVVFFLSVFSAFAYPDQPSDTGAHIRKLEGIMEGKTASAYPLMYFSAGLIHRAFGLPLEIAFGILMGLCSVLTLFVLYWLFIRNAGCPMIVAFLAALCVSVILHVYIPGGVMELYYGQGGGNAWHNPSSTAMKPFAVVSFIAFAMLLDKSARKKGEEGRMRLLNDEGCPENMLIAVFFAATVLGILAKPSFAFGFVIAGAVMMLIRIRHIDRKFFAAMLFTAVVLCCLLFWQSSALFAEGGKHSGGLIFSPARAFYFISLSTRSVPISVASHLLYPAAMLALFYKDIRPLKNNLYLTAWVFYIVSMLIFFSVSEATNPHYMNIGWTRGIAIFTLQTATTLEFVRSIGRRKERSESGPKRKRRYDIRLGAVFVCLLLQVVPGVVWLYSFI